MNTSFEKTKGSDEWYTPKWLIDSLVHGGGIRFDTDPCSPVVKPYEIAPICYTKTDNGLDKEWVGNVWMNPPYSKPWIEKFVIRLASHGKGILLTFDRCDNRLWQEVIFPTCDAVFYIRKRLSFIDENGNSQGNAGCGSCLVAYGQENVDGILRSGIQGVMMKRY